MKIIIDAQLSPHLAVWINQTFGFKAFSVKFLALSSWNKIIDTNSSKIDVAFRPYIGQNII
jgi:predicted nuclease of predicted toxin-antitoxin system